MGLIGIILLLVILISVLVIVRVKHGAFFEPNIREDYPEDLKPFLKMNKCTYRPHAKPRHELLPILDKLRGERKEDVKKVSVDIIGHNFNYEGYSVNDTWYQTLKEIIEKGGHVRLIGGKPDNNGTLENLKDLDADVRFVPEPPTSHLFIYSHEPKPSFIWFEGEHTDNRAIGIVYTTHPNKHDESVAMEYFNSLWETGDSMNGAYAA